nr:MAG TPA: zinc-ribbon containing domain protein [Caudoviricetes sp.]
MTEYISQRKLLLKLMQNGCPASILDIVLSFPAVDTTLAVHGKWVTHYRSGTPVAEGYVSTCCDMWNNRKSDYCPACGAKMDKGDKDDV